MAEPTSQDEYNKKFQQNTKYDGFGVDTATLMPCPGCAEPNWLKMRILATKEDMSKGAVCQHCGRGFRADFVESEPGVIQFEMVQTQGPDLPDWYEPKMRRATT